MILAHALQTTLLVTPILGAARPDLTFLVAISGALLGGVEVGAVAGIAAGILSGIGAAWHPGSFLMSRAIPSAILGQVAQRFSVYHPLSPPACAFAATVLSDAVFFLMSPTEFPPAWWARHAIASGIVHAALIWPVFLIVARVVRPPQKSLFA
jgi:hypothetical protein